MVITKTEKRLCPCCMEIHDVQTILVSENNIFKGVSVEYNAEYFHCDLADEIYAGEEQISKNDISMKNAYRKKVGLLTTDQILGIRSKYRINQHDLCLLLGWDDDTIARYESHQVQDDARDTILRKLDADPKWFLKLLDSAKEFLPPSSYSKYLESGIALLEQNYDHY